MTLLDGSPFRLLPLDLVALDAWNRFAAAQEDFAMLGFSAPGGRRRRPAAPRAAARRSGPASGGSTGWC
ncbi:hypothetical protein [Poseidonocella sp. HB161398]|uniref:hypothetical protein n=1 Tax=Poseidonocella sp. HB161398 TaxID=2320855 RepID=UPI001109EA3C|nr:hypothetical protein [Poseidonocella sp. HB161398]